MRCAPRHCASRRTKKLRRPRSMRKAACGSSVGPSTVRSDRIGLDQLGAADYRAAHHVAVPGNVLGQAVHVEIDVELAVAVRPGERVVEQRQRAMPPGEPGDAGDIGDLEHGVGRRFEHDHPHRPLPEHPLETVQIVYRQQAAGDAEATEHAPDQAARRLVHLGEVHDMVALLAERDAGWPRSRPSPTR